MSAAIGFSVLALLVSFWALYWSRRAALAAEKSASEAERSSSAAERSATASEESAATASDGLAFSKQTALNDAQQARREYLQRLAAEGIQHWPRMGQLYWIVNREHDLTEDEVRELVHRVFAGTGRTKAEAEKHVPTVLEERAKWKS